MTCGNPLAPLFLLRVHRDLAQHFPGFQVVSWIYNQSYAFVPILNGQRWQRVHSDWWESCGAKEESHSYERDRSSLVPCWRHFVLPFYNLRCIVSWPAETPCQVGSQFPACSQQNNPSFTSMSTNILAMTFVASSIFELICNSHSGEIKIFKQRFPIFFWRLLPK